MFDSLTTSANGLILLVYILLVISFFFLGPHKVYESLLGSLIGVVLYLFIHEITFVTPEFTQQVVGGKWLFEHRGALLWGANFLMVFLLFFTPFSVGVNVSGLVRGSLWFFLKLLILPAILVPYITVILTLVTREGALFGKSLLFQGLFEIPYFTNSSTYIWIIDRSYIILFVAILLVLYKITFSHWSDRLMLLLSLMYARSINIFGKPEYPSVPPSTSSEELHHEEAGSEHH